ncbi:MULTISPECIES: DUF6514 family protein [Caproicibacterium]|uniref:DUF6514 family protein n=1 Tax=Caproicibacterium argilliputei TaxID=3030016 RepID=A0AA97H1J7_9FIRM|nr:DUF6514 family protein [Caproicibacterium argilliputei]WOC31785.1 DUF6514 family protein [Caproicibacterium argilliputei]
MTKEEIGKTAVGNTQLIYYVYGTDGSFGVAISEIKTESASGTVSGNRDRAVNLAQTLLRNTVFPENLSEVLEDYSFPD